MFKRILPILMLLLALPFANFAQVTTSNLFGFVKNNKDKSELTGATVKATHTPTGTVYSTSTQKNGRYTFNNMQPGGPYTIEVSFVGFKTQDKTEVYLSLGDNSAIDFNLVDDASNLEAVIVTASSRTPQTSRGGIQTNINAEKMQNAPSVGRNLADYFRLVPQAKTTFEGGISVAGQNNRYNQFMIDGANNNDNFGLSASGTNGGQTGAPPISIDAIESIQIGISPYDVSLGNFTGGAINAITKSGTNQLKGSAYFVYRNQDMAGKTPTGDKSNATKLPDFDNKTYGITLGGPIIKNKLFFFVSGEIQRDEKPQPFDPNTFSVPTFRDSINLLQQKLASYGYNAGDWQNIPDILESNKLTAKITWNASSKHRLNVSYRYTNSEKYLTSASTSTRVNFFNNGYLMPSITNSISAELNSSLNDKMSNRLLLTYTDVNDDRDPIGSPFPRLTINSLNGTSYVLGTENFSTANQLKQKNIALFDEFRWTLGSHQIKAGVDVEHSESYNLFVRDAFGTYTYRWVGDFLNDLRPQAYSRNFSLVDDKIGDGSAAAPTFKTLRAGAFIGDEWTVNSRFQLSYGVRIDNFSFLDKPNTDTFFNNKALGVISQSYDMEGAMSGVRPKANASLAPRLGFTYTIPEENIRLRGGIGLFTGRVPLVWPGGVYNNTGITIGGVSVNNPNITFRPDPFNQWTPTELGQTVRVPSGQIDLIAKDFKLPKVLKTSFGVDKNLGNGFNLTADLLFQKNINEVTYKNVFANPIGKNTYGQDIYGAGITGAQYSSFDLDPTVAGKQNPYATGIFLITNVKDQKGFSYNASATLDKTFSRGFNASVGYSYGDAYGIFDGTSSQNNSQWRYMEAQNGRNNLTRSRSDFAQLHRVTAYLSKRFQYANKSLATTVTLFYNGQSGTPYSYVYTRSMIFDQNGSNSETTDLIYIPKDLADWSRVAVPYTQGGVTYSVAQQWDLLNAYISSDKYLNNRRGQFAERNGANLPFSNVVDLQVKQDFMLKFGKTRNKFSLQFDIFNFTNMLNRDWGKVYITPGIDSYSLISMEGYSAVTTGGVTTYKPNLTYRNLTNRTAGDILDIRSNSYLSTRWKGQVTIRYNFN